jgi:uncharacterized protein YwgA
MDAESLVLAVLKAVPKREVRGKKRLQKLAYFAVQAGTPADVRFFLHDFGPFSTQVANAANVLSYVGTISEDEEQFARTKRYYKCYRITDLAAVNEDLPVSASQALGKLDAYSTIELEVASTIRYFMDKGQTAADAIQSTRELKPTKSQQQIIERAREALSEAGLYERRGTYKVSGPRSNQL